MNFLAISVVYHLTFPLTRLPDKLLEENKGVRDLGRSPLLLSMICLAYEETLSIPKRRVELYEEALDALLKKWDSSRKIKRDQTYKQLSIGHKRQMFAQIAAEYFDKGEIFFHAKELAGKIEAFLSRLPPDPVNEPPDGEAILETISAQHGILIERARGIYSFSHLTFQEYYTAKYIVDNANRGTLERLATHLQDYRWREVFLLTSSLLSEATPLFETLSKEAQQILQKHPNLLETQTWATNRAAQISAFKNNTKRNIYWLIPLNLAHTRVLGQARDLARERTRNLALQLSNKLARDLALEFARQITIDLAQDLDRELSLGLDLNTEFVNDLVSVYARARDLNNDLANIRNNELNLARDLAREQARNHAYGLNRARARDLNLERTRTQNRAHELARELVHDLEQAYVHELDLELEHSLARAINNSQYSSPQVHDALVTFRFELNTAYLAIFSNIFTFLETEYRSNDRVEHFRSFLNAWQGTSPDSFSNHETITCPSYKASSREWQEFEDNIYKLVESSLQIDLSKKWTSEEYKAALEYIQTNQLFWNCLQVARVEDRDAIEDMMFRAPDKRE